MFFDSGLAHPGIPDPWMSAQRRAQNVGGWEHTGDSQSKGATMLGVHTYLHWTDADGTQRSLPGWSSQDMVSVQDNSACEGRDLGGTCRCDAPHPWRGLAEREAVLSHGGDGYPTRYELAVEGLIDLYLRAERQAIRELTLEGGPVDTATRVAELRALAPGTIVVVKEWDQS
ncbi:hypothetical protein [Pseudoclavibacter sp. RFBB5]|uniref:hypothetical protein n=1 Tax=Pseudoclavibacter sp. RFBB5 TaxID=2080574 RepID=UPI0011AFF4D0|nr:hypothetical protein [Pseudoclavibacter sp. RFBB5]